MFEGIYVASSISTREMIIQQVEEVIVSSTNGEQTYKTINFFTEDKIHLSLEKVAWVEFIDEKREEFCLNLCREGLRQIPRVKVQQKDLKIEMQVNTVELPVLKI